MSNRGEDGTWVHGDSAWGPVSDQVELGDADETGMCVPVCRLCLRIGVLGFFLADYVLALEAEIRNLKHKFKTLEEQLEEPPRVFSSNADIQPRVCTSAGATGERLCPGVVRAQSQ